jgi:DNA-binding PucR family transcriptional regulator
MELPSSCPDPDIEAVHLAVRGGMTLAELLKAYRIGHACTLDGWLDAIEDLEISDSEARACITAVTRFVAQYDERLADFVADEYQRERTRLARNTDGTQFKLFRDLIEGRAVEANGLEYPLDLEHIGVVAWGAEAEQALRRLAQVIDRRLFFVRADEGFLMGWLGGREELSADVRERLRRFQPPADSALALGNPEREHEGLRRTHRQAGDAHVVAIRRPQPVTFYSDVALEALALRNEAAAADFVSDVLDGLDADDARSAELRETLAVYFAAEQNATSAAAQLGVHDSTITRRLAEIERRAGGRVNRRRAELEAALRLRELLTPR